MRWKVVLLLIALLIFIISCSEDIPSDKQCTSDDDCVAATCCHANDSVNKDHAPDCSTSICTLNCAPDTLDCAQGEIKCVDNQCTAIIFENETLT